MDNKQLYLSPLGGVAERELEVRDLFLYWVALPLLVKNHTYGADEIGGLLRAAPFQVKVKASPGQGR
jgi:hypothetical protein